MTRNEWKGGIEKDEMYEDNSDSMLKSNNTCKVDLKPQMSLVHIVIQVRPNTGYIKLLLAGVCFMQQPSKAPDTRWTAGMFDFLSTCTLKFYKKEITCLYFHLFGIYNMPVREFLNLFLSVMWNGQNQQWIYLKRFKSINIFF